MNGATPLSGSGEDRRHNVFIIKTVRVSRFKKEWEESINLRMNGKGPKRWWGLYEDHGTCVVEWPVKIDWKISTMMRSSKDFFLSASNGTHPSPPQNFSLFKSHQWFLASVKHRKKRYEPKVNELLTRKALECIKHSTGEKSKRKANVEEKCRKSKLVPCGVFRVHFFCFLIRTSFSLFFVYFSGSVTPEWRCNNCALCSLPKPFAPSLDI